MNSYREKSNKYRNFFIELKNGSDFTDKTIDGQFYAPAYNLVIWSFQILVSIADYPVFFSQRVLNSLLNLRSKSKK